jgi:hypothetical protein
VRSPALILTSPVTTSIVTEIGSGVSKVGMAVLLVAMAGQRTQPV